MIDTLKIKTNIESINKVDYDRFGMRQKEANFETGEIYVPVNSLNTRKLGGAYYEIAKDGLVTIEFSAKVLNSDYSKGLSENTIVKAIDNINSISNGAIELNANRVIDNGIVTRVDSCINSEVDDIQATLSALRNVTNCKYKKNIDTQHDTTIYFNKDSRQESYMFYNKNAELMKKDKHLLDQFKPNTMRYEISQKGKKKIISTSGTRELAKILKLENCKQRLYKSLTNFEIDMQEPLFISNAIKVFEDKNVSIDRALCCVFVSENESIDSFYSRYSKSFLRELLHKRFSHLEMSSRKVTVSRFMKRIDDTLNSITGKVYDRKELQVVGSDYLQSLKTLVS